MSRLLMTTNQNQNELAASIKHEGIRVGEIIASRAWRVIGPGWLRRREVARVLINAQMSGLGAKRKFSAYQSTF
jgi:hypothetical protein